MSSGRRLQPTSMRHCRLAQKKAVHANGSRIFLLSGKGRLSTCAKFRNDRSCHNETKNCYANLHGELGKSNSAFPAKSAYVRRRVTYDRAEPRLMIGIVSLSPSFVVRDEFYHYRITFPRRRVSGKVARTIFLFVSEFSIRRHPSHRRFKVFHIIRIALSVPRQMTHREGSL